MADSIVAQAAVKLMMKFPFWCELYYSMKVIESDKIPTLCTDGKRMWVNPTFWEGLSHDHRVAALAHETTHKMLHHCTRGQGLDPNWCNIAMDVVVNTMLSENGFSIHPKWVQPEKKYSGWTFEAVYHDLTKDIQKPPPPPAGGGDPEEDDGEQEQPGGGGAGDDEEDGEEGDDDADGKGGGDQQEDGDGDGSEAGNDDGGKVPTPQAGQGQADGKGAGKDDPDAAAAGSGFCDSPDIPQKYKGAWKDVQQVKGTTEEIEAHEEKVEEAVKNAIEQAKAMGNAPKGVEMAVDQVIKVPEERWYDHLHRYFQSLRMSEYDWARINRRMAVRHRIVAPTQYTPKLGPAVVLIDASGSVYEKAMQMNFASHVNAILAEAQPSVLYVGHFDTVVHGDFLEIPLGELELDKVPRGGGGTDFREPLARAEEFSPSVVIVLTDLMGTFPSEPPPFPVVWASIYPGTAPFGETVHIKEKA